MPPRVTFTVLLTMLGCLILSSVADGQPVPPTDPMRDLALREAARDVFAGMDADGDGRISSSEWTQSPLFFLAGDANKDGSLDFEEALKLFQTLKMIKPKASMMVGPPRFFWLADANADNKVSREELTAAVAKLQTADIDGDKLIDLEEFGVYVDSASTGDRFRQRDVDGNGGITLTEWRGGRYAFLRADANGDGKISFAEWKAIQ